MKSTSTSDFRKDLHVGICLDGLFGKSEQKKSSASLHKQQLSPAARWTRIVIHVPDLLAVGAGERLWEHTKGWLINGHGNKIICGNMLRRK